MIVLAISNQLKGSRSDNTLFLKYRSTNNLFGFNYKNAPSDFYQQVRIDADLQKTNFQVKETVYRKHDGNFVKPKVIIEKTKELITDWFDDETHEALVVALNHPEVFIDNTQYFFQGDYELEDNEFDYTQKAKAVLYEQGYNRTNITC